MNCYLCDSELRQIYKKFSPVLNTEYSIFQCTACGLWQIQPIPSNEELSALYEESYFHQRTERGYNFYESEKVRKSIESTFYKNLKDLHFFQWEEILREKNATMHSLDIGCAAGYFVHYLKERKWEAKGIDVSGIMVQAAQKNGLDVIQGDFLNTSFKPESFDLITMWATIEHLPNPLNFIEKISSILKPGGRLILSTCNTGFFAKIRKDKWRFLNVPEHIFYFNQKNLIIAAKKNNLYKGKIFSYGSGFTTKSTASIFYRIQKKILDNIARYFLLGDMIVAEFIKK